MYRELKPLQEEGSTFLARESPKSLRGRRCLFADMGTGKTPMASKTAALLNCRRILILCKDSGLNVWRYDGKLWLEQFFEPLGIHALYMHFMTDEPWNRELDWNTHPPMSFGGSSLLRNAELHVYVCVYNTFANDMGVYSKQGSKQQQVKRRSRGIQRIVGRHVRFDMIILDECRRLSDRKSAAYLAVRKFLTENGAKYILPMSGTPGHWPPDYWTYFNLIDRKKFSSYWQFVQHFMVCDDGPFGLEVLEQRTDTKQEWDRLLNEYCYIIPPGVMKPPVQRQLLVYEMEDDQKKLVKELQETMLSMVGDEVVFAQNAMVLFLRLRQALICPRILVSDASYGGAIRHFVSQIQEYPDEAHTVIFTPFTHAFEHFKTYLEKGGYKNVFTLSGGITSAQQTERIQTYRDTKGIIICSVKYAEAFSLEPAKKCWFIGYDEDPDVNRQAEGRLSRLTSAGDVMANYLTANTPNDLRMAEIIAIKQMHVNFALPENIKQLWATKR